MFGCDVINILTIDFFTPPKKRPGINLFLVCLFLCASNVYACSTDKWNPGASGNVSANDPSNGVPNVSGACGLKVHGEGYVQDNSPDTEAQFKGSFYYLPQFDGAGSTDIFVAYSNEASVELFSIVYNGSSIKLDASAATGGSSTSINVDNNHWHRIEFSWKSGETGQLWVNADAAVDPATSTFASGVGTVESVRLGAPGGFGGLNGMAFFDNYVSDRSVPAGGIVAGDGNSDGVVDSDDIEAIVEEFLFETYAEGVSDCNLDGEVNSSDVNCVVAKF